MASKLGRNLNVVSNGHDDDFVDRCFDNAVGRFVAVRTPANIGGDVQNCDIRIVSGHDREEFLRSISNLRCDESLNSWSTIIPYPHSERPKRPSAVIYVVILPTRRQLKLVRTEVEPSVQNCSTV